ncbi:DUF4240 domain-containing protein [Acutalibacter caecimuris]|uniref:DUF4240 domain-containing protein n=1 Tax=Acutalibacter caecimuris TaxID=3093657 RepID=UPI002AC8C1BA|nr:DUF4240 domain-containing protein [Acutalibacter sp. M00118]
MSKDGFWSLISEVKAACGQDQDKYLDTLKTRLKELGPDHAQDFHDIVHAYEDLAYKYGLWSASELMGRATDDSFIDFRAWLISQGKEAYFAALKDPDSMADLDPGDGYWFESFTYAGDYALEKLTGESAYDHTDKAAYDKLIEALKADIDYGEGINYPCESDEVADLFPRLFERYQHDSREFFYEGGWNYDDPDILKARLAGPPPKPESKNTMEMGGM